VESITITFLTFPELETTSPICDSMLSCPAKILHFLIIIFCFSCFHSAGAQERIALLIGNSKYSEKVGKLVNPPNDIQLMKKALEALHFKVNAVSELGYADMEQAIKEHVRKVREAGPGTISFLYYSGHGGSDSAGVNYLIPIDVSNADEDTLWDRSVDLKADIVERMETSAPDAVHFVVFDACRNELQLMRNGQKSMTVDGKSFSPLPPTGPVLIAYSTAARRPASDYGIGGGPYARALSEEIVTPGLEAVSMFRSVQLRVQKAIGQQPFLAVAGIPEVFLAGRPSSASVAATPTGVVPAAATSAEEQQAFEAERASSHRAMADLLTELRKSGKKPGVSSLVVRFGSPGLHCISVSWMGTRYIADTSQISQVNGPYTGTYDSILAA
jgi:uncharacterized caspase-like protein